MRKSFSVKIKFKILVLFHGTICIFFANQNCKLQIREEKLENESEINFVLKPLKYLIDDHISHATHFDGPRCQMYPTCSRYGDIAITKFSFFGFFLLIDRMFFREASGNLSMKYMIIEFSEKNNGYSYRYFDPIEEVFPILKDSRPSLFKENLNFIIEPVQ